MLEPRAGYWSLVAFSIAFWAVLFALWSLTGVRLLDRWLRRCSWLLPALLYLAYRGHHIAVDPRSIRTFEDYNLFMTRLFVHDTEVLAARSIPGLTLSLLVLIALIVLRNRIQPRLSRFQSGV